MSLSISELAREAGVNLETIRYYERCGLLPEPPRNAQGHRQYPREFLQHIRFIKRAQAMSFSLREVADLVGLKNNQRATCKDVVILTQKKCDEIENKILMLEKIRKHLTWLIENCPGDESLLKICPIIEAFNGKPNDCD